MSQNRAKKQIERKRSMDDRKKKAWIYTRIDAPEDSHGTLKKQYEQLNTYGEQLRMEIAGGSSDMGETAGLERPGLELSWRQRTAGGSKCCWFWIPPGSPVIRNWLRIFCSGCVSVGLKYVLLWRE